MDALDHLRKHQQRLSRIPLVDHFSDNAERAGHFSFSGAGLTLDLSKNHLDQAAISALLDWARQQKVEQAIDALFQAQIVNPTENKSAVHPFLRATGLADSTPVSAPACKASQQYAEQAKQVRRKMAGFCKGVHSGQRVGATGKPFTQVVNMGIGGSDLGPRMVSQALWPHKVSKLTAHYVANLDPLDFYETVDELDPETTLFIVASKSFGTQETLANAALARSWLAEAGIDNWSTQMVAVTANPETAVASGFHPELVFDFDSAVGGRYSLWSSVGLSLMLVLGEEVFSRLLAGAEQMDRHFQEAPADRNLPVLLALVYAWYRNFWGRESHAVLPYAHGLRQFSDYLQQLEMESLGKSVDLAGQPVPMSTGGVIWGQAGTNGQHSFYQLLHQGCDWVPVDFIFVLHSAEKRFDEGHKQLLSHGIAQSRALMTGKGLKSAEQGFARQGCSPEEARQLAPHSVHSGNRPSSAIVLEKLTPESLGALIALYEHKVYVLARLWGVNPFDQWGVEYGKMLSRDALLKLNAQTLKEDWDSSSETLIKRYLNKPN